MKEPQPEKSNEVSPPRDRAQTNESQAPNPQSQVYGQLSFLQPVREAGSLDQMSFTGQPAFLYTYLIVTGAVYVFSYLNVLIHLLTDVSIIRSLMHHPGQSITSLYIWQPFTCLYVNITLWEALWNGFCLWIHLYERDQEKGTTHAILSLGWINFLLQACMIVAYYVTSLFGVSEHLWYSNGFLPVYIFLLSKKCYEAQEEMSTLFCFPCPIKNKIYPFVFAVLSACIVGLRLDYFLSICLGYAATRLIMIQKVIDIKPETAQKYDSFVKKTHLYGKWAEPPVDPAETLDNTPSKIVTNIAEDTPVANNANTLETPQKGPKDDFVINDIEIKDELV